MATLVVDQLQYQPMGPKYEVMMESLQDFYSVDTGETETSEEILTKIKRKVNRGIESLDVVQTVGCITDVSFIARPHSITALIGPDRQELKYDYFHEYRYLLPSVCNVCLVHGL